MSETIQILEKVNAFYVGAFSQLVTFTVGLLALVGVLIPIGIASYQNRQMKRDQKVLTERIENELNAVRVALSEQIAKDISEKEAAIKLLIDEAKKEISHQLEKIDELAIARSFHLQAISHYRTSPASGASDCLASVRAYAKGGDEQNLRAIISIWGECIENVTEEDFKVFDLAEDSQKTIEALTELNGNGRYVEDIRSIKRGIEEAKTRKARKEPAQS